MASIPLSEYPDNSKFDNSIVSGASSCVAFAKHVYGKLWKNSGSSISENTDISEIKWGSWIHTDYNGGHDMIIGSQKDGNVYIYDANWVDYGSGNPYTVDYRSMTIEGFRKKFTIKGGKNAGSN